MTYQEDLKLLVSMIPEEVQGDGSYFAAQRLYELARHADEKKGNSYNPEGHAETTGGSA
jgi:hypothetical protein